MKKYSALRLKKSADSSDFANDLLLALRRRPRSLSPKHFYDAHGSALFDKICLLPEYYPTRTELGILTRKASQIAALMGPHAELIEFGAGSLRKVRVLLDAMEAPARYIPIDISGDHLAHAADILQKDYPLLEIYPVVADYTAPLTLPSLRKDNAQRIGFFPGSTIGNFSPQEAAAFLKMAGKLLRGGALLLGADLIKTPRVLHAAYNDTQGITALFNMNVLARANRELSANFDPEKFEHCAFYNAPLQRIEMHLVSRFHQTISVCDEHFEFEEGETLHTENSYKFTINSLHKLAKEAGFLPGPVWTDPGGLFSLHWLNAPK